MVLARIWGLLLDVAVFFVIEMIDGSKATLKRLELVMPYMPRCGGYIWVWTWLGGSITLILEWKVIQRF